MDIDPFPKISNPSTEGVLQVSKSLKYQVLLDLPEMEDLLSFLGDLFLYSVSQVVDREKGVISKEEFLSVYGEYCQSLKQGEVPDQSKTRPYFSSVFTTSPESLYAHEVKKDRYLIKPISPVMQLQNHSFYFSEVDGKIHSGVLSGDAISWGIQFSYPQIAIHPITGEFLKATDQKLFPNAKLFSSMTKWMRENTAPTPFLINGVKTISPIRLGKNCFSWIRNHPQFEKKGLTYAI